MTAATSVAIARRTPWDDSDIRHEHGGMRTRVIVAGIGSAVLFMVVGLHYQLQLYADGSMFSYAVAVEDAWAFHWHNISGRLFVYACTDLPAEIYVALTGDARGGVAVFGLLFFAAQLAGLVATWIADRSRGSVIFTYACASTACLCPLVFGFPTEMWVAHALFWPALALCHYAPPGRCGRALLFAVMLALALTHEGALVLAVVILGTALLRGTDDALVRRAAGAFLAVMMIWTAVKLTLPPDDYDGPVMRWAALHFFDLTIFTSYVLVLLVAVLAAYGVAFLALYRLSPKAHLYAVLLVALGLVVYWLGYDRSLDGDQRYTLRTVLLIGTAALGLLAGAYALAADGCLKLRVPFLPQLLSALAQRASLRAVTGAVLLVMLVHAVETARFVRAWTDYTAAVKQLATGTASDPSLGDARFVSSARIDPVRDRLSWFSTTPYLSVLLAPGFAPARLVVDPTARYFWLSCETATANERADRAIPVDSRRLVRVYACLHRP
jgi:hypothetical protein